MAETVSAESLRRVADLMPDLEADLTRLVEPVHLRAELSSNASSAPRGSGAGAFRDVAFPFSTRSAADTAPVMMGEIPAPTAPTVLLYSHYDVVPVGTSRGSNAFEATGRDGAIYGRRSR
jgi:acetylornithine deacetylase/succinyl-diaminopimelate desuccinylase-like protein